MFFSLFSARISLGELARLCRRLGTSLEAGIDVRSVWTREARQATRPAARRRFRAVSDAVSRGESLSDALALTGDFFPPMFCEISRVGEETGHLAESFAQLAEHYEEQLRLRRILVAASIWPVAELCIALAIVGFMIWIMGVINRGNAEPIDPLGLGLLGTRGLLIYVTFLAVVGGALFMVIHAIRRGMLWTRPIQRLLLRLPGLGRALQNVALSRLAWAMHVTFDAGMGTRRALRLSLQSTRNAHYTDHIKPIDAEIERGNPIYEAFLETGAFPTQFVEAIQVGETSGRLVESMALLSRQYREQAELAFRALATIGGFAIWGLVALIIIVLIFRLALFYINTITGLL